MIRIGKSTPEPAEPRTIRVVATILEPGPQTIKTVVAVYEPASVVFDYADLNEADARELRETAERVRRRHADQIASMMETGRDLAAAKERLGHGKFGLWLAAEFRWSERTAQNYMRAFSTLGPKSETVADLTPTIIHKLAAAPAPIRERVLQRREAEHVPADRVRDVLAEEIAAEKTVKAEAAMTPDQRRKPQAKRRREQRERERFEADRAAQRDAVDAINSRVAHLLIELAGERLPALSEALAGSSFEPLRRWLEMPDGWTVDRFGRFVPK
jgi:hypothetical protein